MRVKYLREMLLTLCLIICSACSSVNQKKDLDVSQPLPALLEGDVPPRPTYEPENNADFFSRGIKQTDDYLTNGWATFFWIIEGTQNQYVSVGSDGNIRRWEYKGDNTQVWCVYPAKYDSSDARTQYRIETLQNKEFMAVGSNGNILRYGKKDDGSQLFELAKAAKGTYNIVISVADNQYVAVGSDGNILRWDASGDDDQEFKFVPADTLGYKKTAPEQPIKVAGRKAYVPGKVPLPAPLTSVRAPVLASERYLISETLMPATVVNDPSFSTKIDQVNTSPYYYLIREQYYKPTAVLLPPGKDQTTSITITVSFTSSEIQQITNTVGWSLDYTISAKEGDASAALKFQYQQSTERMKKESSEHSKTKKSEETVSWKSPSKLNTRIVIWQLMDVFTIWDGNGSKVQSTGWESEFTKFADMYPPVPGELTLK